MRAGLRKQKRWRGIAERMKDPARQTTPLEQRFYLRMRHRHDFADLYQSVNPTNGGNR